MGKQSTKNTKKHLFPPTEGCFCSKHATMQFVIKKAYNGIEKG